MQISTSLPQRLQRTHKMHLTRLNAKCNPNISPDPNNVDNYCNSCNWTYSSRKNYLSHLKDKHNIISQKLVPGPNILSDVDDPNFYCKSCESKSKNHSLYRTHVQRVHKMQLTPSLKQPTFDLSITIEGTKNPKNTSCAICRKDSYQKHMEKVHKDGKNTPGIGLKCISDPNIQPDPMVQIIIAAHVKDNTKIIKATDITFFTYTLMLKWKKLLKHYSK